MKKEPNYLEKIRLQNMILLVLAGISSVISILDLPTILVNSKQVELYEKQMAIAKTPEVVSALEKSLTIVTHPAYRLYSLAMLVLVMILFVGFYRNNRKIKTNNLVKEWPYYGQIFRIVLALVVSVSTQALAFNLNTSIITIFLNLVWCIPAILALKYRKNYVRKETDLSNAA